MPGEHHRVSALVSRGRSNHQCGLLQTVRLLYDPVLRHCQHQCVRVVVIRWSVIVRTPGILLPHPVTPSKYLTNQHSVFIFSTNHSLSPPTWWRVSGV